MMDKIDIPAIRRWQDDNGLSRKDLPWPTRPCPYCTNVRTGLPDNACENCLGTGLHPDDAAVVYELCVDDVVFIEGERPCNTQT